MGIIGAHSTNLSMPSSAARSANESPDHHGAPRPRMPTPKGSFDRFSIQRVLPPPLSRTSSAARSAHESPDYHGAPRARVTTPKIANSSDFTPAGSPS